MNNVPDKIFSRNEAKWVLTRVAISSIPLVIASTSVAMDLIKNGPYEPHEDTKAHELIVEEYPEAKNFDIEYHEDGISTMTFEVNGKLCQSKVREVVTGQSSGSKTTDILPADTPIQIDCLR